LGDGGADLVGIEAAGEQLDDDDAGVFVDDEAGELVGFTEDEAAGVREGVEHGAAAGDGGAETVCEEGEPGRLGDQFASNDAEGKLGGRAEERGAEENAAAIDDGDEAGWFAGPEFKSHELRGVDPEVALAERFGGSAGDNRIGGGDVEFGGGGTGGGLRRP